MDSTGNELFPINIVTKSDEFVFEVCAKIKIKLLKWKIYEKMKIEPKHQRLFFEGIELDEPEYKLSGYGIEPQYDSNGARQNTEFTVMLAEFYQGIPQTYFLDEAHYDPKWNCSYQGIESKKLMRGGKEYFQPIGCVRYGLKVLGKYENDTWLGCKGYRTEDEWPVAYHGTKELNEILRKGFLIAKGVRFALGKGIYCSPHPQVAYEYAHNYKFEDKLYKLIIQCRVDPQKMQIHEDCWLVTDEKYIRPYAICVYSDEGYKELIRDIEYPSVKKFKRFKQSSSGSLPSNSYSSSAVQPKALPPPPAAAPAAPADVGTGE